MVSDKLTNIIETGLDELGFDLVRVHLTGAALGNGKNKSQRRHLQIMAEPSDGREMTVEDCADISRHLSVMLDVEDIIFDAYLLEVSSPGLDRPLTKPADFERFEGELAKISLRQMIEGRRRFQGRISGRGEDGTLHLETGFGRVSFTFDELDSARLDPTEYFSAKTRPGKKKKPAPASPAEPTQENE